MGKFRMRLAQFMYGRNGVDALYHVLMWVAIVLMVVNFFVKNWIISLIELLLLIYAMFRFFSRNVYKRQRENQVVLRLFQSVKRWASYRKIRRRDRKTHVFRICPSCRNRLRLPRVKGKHVVCCPCCRNRFDVEV